MEAPGKTVTSCAPREQWEVTCEIAGNTVRQLRRPAYSGEAAVYKLVVGRHEGYRVEAAGQRRRAHQVAEHHRELAAFRLGGGGRGVDGSDGILSGGGACRSGW